MVVEWKGLMFTFRCVIVSMSARGLVSETRGKQEKLICEWTLTRDSGMNIGQLTAYNLPYTQHTLCGFSFH